MQLRKSLQLTWEAFVEKVQELVSVDTRALAVMRITLGLLIIIDLLNRARSLTAHYGGTSVLPARAIALEDAWSIGHWSLHTFSGAAAYQVGLFVLAGIFAVMLVIGWRTTLATVASWALLISLQNANPLVLQGGDVVFRLAVFWGIFLPWGKTYSVDVALHPEKAQKKKTIATMGTFAFLLQIALIYIFAGLLKTGDAWASGDAVFMALMIDQFATPLADLTLKFPSVMQALTHWVVWTDLLAPTLIFLPFWNKYSRTFIAFMLAAMHIGFAAHLQIGLFPYISLATFLVVFPTWIWDKVFDRLKTKERLGLELFYDGTCGLCKTLVRLIKTFLLIPETRVTPAQYNKAIEEKMFRENSWVVVDHTGTQHTHFDGVIAVAAHSPLLRYTVPLLKLSWIYALGQRVYRWVANHRGTVCSLEEETPLPLVDESFRDVFLKVFHGLVVTTFVVFVVWWNIGALPTTDIKRPTTMRRVVAVLRLDQYWNMFAPDPLKDDGWYVMPVTLADGRTFDLFQGNEQVSFEKPADVSSTYSSQRWRKYLMNLWQKKNSRYRKYYANRQCYEWNSVHTGDDAMRTFQMLFMREKTLGYLETETPTQVVLGTWQCDGTKAIGD